MCCETNRITYSDHFNSLLYLLAYFSSKLLLKYEFKVPTRVRRGLNYGFYGKLTYKYHISQ